MDPVQPVTANEAGRYLDSILEKAFAKKTVFHNFVLKVVSKPENNNVYWKTYLAL